MSVCPPSHIEVPGAESGCGWSPGPVGKTQSLPPSPRQGPLCCRTRALEVQRGVGPWGLCLPHDRIPILVCSMSGTKNSAPFSASMSVGLCVCPSGLVHGGRTGFWGSRGSGQWGCLSRSSLSSVKARPSGWDLDAGLPAAPHCVAWCVCAAAGAWPPKLGRSCVLPVPGSQSAGR